MGRDVQGHESLQERFGSFVVTEQCVSVDVIQVARCRKWTTGYDARHGSDVKTKQLVQPAFDGVAVSVSNRLVEGDFVERATEDIL